MKKAIQILVLSTLLLPLASIAREETLEERKQRIVRKYLRARANITQSDMVVPSDLPEDERVLDSEKFIEPEVDIAKQEPGTRPPPPMPRPRPVPRPQEENWLFPDESQMDDPYADPFAKEKKTDTGREDLWSKWGYGDPSPQGGYDRGENRFGQRDSNPYVRENPYSRDHGSLGLGARDDGSEDLFGGRMDTGTSVLNPSLPGSGTFGSSSPETGWLKTPFSRRDSSDDVKTQPVVPRQRKPYFTPRGQKQPVQDRRQEFQRTNPYQQWKEKNRAWDPTKDDAYLDELMQRNRR